MSNPVPLLQTKGLGRSYGARVALEGLDLALEPGERLAILGPSGSGKTTLLRMIAGLDPPTTGAIELSGKPASEAGRVVVAPERRGVALVFQGLALFPHMTALEQVRFVARGVSIARAVELLARAGLGGRETALPTELSGGERQRLALVRALAQEPALLLLDEPFANLDDALHAALRADLRAMLEASRTALVLVTHERADVFALAGRVLVLEGGKKVTDGDVEALVARPRKVQVVRALGLGFVIAGEVVGAGEVATAFGPARARCEGRSGAVSLLVRPEQARVLAEEELGGVAGEVVAVELEAPEARALRHGVTVRVGTASVRARAAAPVPRPGAKVRVSLEGELEALD
jgi:ABC-type Fe3+/spermidine/putrescine transport system ATPase subunit